MITLGENRYWLYIEIDNKKSYDIYDIFGKYDSPLLMYDLYITYQYFCCDLNIFAKILFDTKYIPWCWLPVAYFFPVFGGPVLYDESPHELPNHILLFLNLGIA